MNLSIKFLSVIFCCFIFVSYSTREKESDSQSVINAEDIVKHLQVLASDEFLGRKPFSEGEEKTVEYISTQFENIGLKPGNGDSYYQSVPLVEINSTVVGGKIPVAKTGSRDTTSLKYWDDFVAQTRRVVDSVEVKNSELVFAGFGIVAPEYNWNDYEGLDVKGKTVVVMVNDPGFGGTDSTFFKGNTMTYYGRWTYKFEEAARQGATGVLIIHETAPASYPWGVVQNSWSGSQLYQQSPDNNMSRAVVEGWITLDAAKKLFALSGKSVDMESAKKSGFKPVPLGLTISAVLKNQIKKNESKNVIAILPGTDQKDEYIFYTAHWDHLGVGAVIDGDSIYNGAVDNATGVAALFEIAEAFIKASEKPKRSIVFLAVTAEEQGLLGSEYYAENPIYPLNKTVAVLNMDALGVIGEMKDLSIVGLGQSEMDDYARKVAENQGRYILGDKNPGAGSFFRSDHFNFAKKGVPALYAAGGVESKAHGKEWVEQQHKEYREKKYHQPADEYDSASWDLSGMVQDLQLLYQIGNEISHSADWPNWKEGSEFKSIREASRK